MPTMNEAEARNKMEELLSAEKLIPEYAEQYENTVLSYSIHGGEAGAYADTRKNAAEYQRKIEKHENEMKAIEEIFASGDFEKVKAYEKGTAKEIVVEGKSPVIANLMKAEKDPIHEAHKARVDYCKNERNDAQRFIEA